MADEEFRENAAAGLLSETDDTFRERAANVLVKKNLEITELSGTVTQLRDRMDHMGKLYSNLARRSNDQTRQRHLSNQVTPKSREN